MQEESHISCRTYISTSQDEEGIPSEAHNWISHIIACSVNPRLTSCCLASAKAFSLSLCGRSTAAVPCAPIHANARAAAQSHGQQICRVAPAPRFSLECRASSTCQLWNPVQLSVWVLCYGKWFISCRHPWCARCEGKLGYVQRQLIETAWGVLPRNESCTKLWTFDLLGGKNEKS